MEADASTELMVSAINMPCMDGLALIEKLQSMEHVSAIVVSADGDMANIRTALNRGAFDQSAVK